MSVDYELDFICRRYNRLASIYPLFDLLFLLPPNIAAKAVTRLELKPGDKVLEVGCGTGRNIGRLVEAVGPTGQVFAVDCCDGMLAKAAGLCKRHEWHNVKLCQQEAAKLLLPVPVDGVLFSLSYSVMPKPLNALSKAWEFLHPERHVVILDGKPARGPLGRLSRPFVTFLSKATVLGDLDRRPWEDLKTLTPRIEMEEVNLGTYYICRGTKL